MSYQKFRSAVLDNRKFFKTTSIEYEKNPYSMLVHNEDDMKDQQNYTYGMPLQDDIYQYRYDSFLTGNRDTDVKIVPYTDIQLPNKIRQERPPIPIKENFRYQEKEKEKESAVCGSGNCSESLDESRYESLYESRDESRDESYNAEEEENVVCGVGENAHNICNTNQKLYKILDPRFNLREAAKNCILLEDHLFQYGKRCGDCIKKHCLMIEGFLEEGVTLDKNREHTEEFMIAIKEFREIFKELSGKLVDGSITDFDCVQIAQQIRKLRKPLCQKYATFF
jgi:hypothetical protein